MRRRTCPGVLGGGIVDGLGVPAWESGLGADGGGKLPFSRVSDLDGLDLSVGRDGAGPLAICITAGDWRPSRGGWSA